MRLDAFAGRGVAIRQGAGTIRYTATPTLWVRKLTQDGKDKITKIRFEEHWKSVIVTFVKAAPVSRCEQKCKTSRDNFMKFSFLMLQLNLTRSQNCTWILVKGDSESSDRGGIETAVEPNGVQRHRVSPCATAQTDPEQTATQCNRTVRCQPDQDDTDHFRDHKRIHAHDHANLFINFSAIFLQPTSESVSMKFCLVL